MWSCCKGIAQREGLGHEWRAQVGGKGGGASDKELLLLAQLNS